MRAVRPRSETSDALSWSKAGRTMLQARKKILCIEDDRETAKLIAEELSQRGFHPLIAYDGQVGLAAITKRIPDLVLCDVTLPEMSGFEVLARRNENMPPLGRVPFIFLTGATGRYSELQGRTLGADDYLAKPVDFDILEMVIRVRLAGGIARHGLAAQSATSGRSREVLPKLATPAHIVELIDAPMVHQGLDQSPQEAALNEELAARDLDGSRRGA